MIWNYTESSLHCAMIKIIDALVERNSIIEKIMAYKEEYGMSIIQPKQEEKQERQLAIKLDGNKYSDEIEDVFRRIRRNSKRIQARKLLIIILC